MSSLNCLSLLIHHPESSPSRIDLFRRAAIGAAQEANDLRRMQLSERGVPNDIHVGIPIHSGVSDDDNERKCLPFDCREGLLQAYACQGASGVAAKRFGESAAVNRVSINNENLFHRGSGVE